MIRRAFLSLFVCAAVFLAPLALNPERALHPAPWMGMVIAMIILLSQPTLPLREAASRSAADRGSALAIFVAMIAAQLVAAIEFSAAREGVPGVPLALGSVLGAAGLALRLNAIRTLGRFFTSTVRVAEDQAVVQSGPYRWLRHPSYTGALMAALGTTILLESRVGSGLVLLLCVPAYLYRIAVEEKALLKRLGPAYATYRSATRSLVPCIW